MIREVLTGGDLRLSGKSGAFIFHRLRPGVVLTAFRGSDSGEFGLSPLEVIAQEHRLFNKPVEWFIDASGVERTTNAVSADWTSWLRNHRASLARMHVLTSDEETRLRMSVARHFSDSMKEMILYSDRAKWEQAVLLRVPGLSAIPDIGACFHALPVEISRVQSSEPGLSLGAPGCRWTFRSLSNRAIFSTFEGSDTGELTNLALEEMQRLLDAAPAKVYWFLDLRAALNVATNVSQTWTEWLTAQHHRLARLSAFAPSPLFPLVLTIAKYRSGTDRFFHIHRDIEPFREELIAVTSGDVAKAVGV